MEELHALISLLQHADDQIDKSVTIAMTLLGVVATFTMTATFAERYNWFLKACMSVFLTVILFYNRDTIIDQMHIYNALVVQLGALDVTNVSQLFLPGEQSVYTKLSPTSMWLAHGAASWFIHLLIWHIEIKNWLLPKWQAWRKKDV